MEQEQDSLDLSKYLEILGRWWWVLLIVPILAGSVSFYQANQQTRMYRATADILVQQARQGLVGTQVSSANEDLAATYARLATTRELQNRTQAELGLSYLPVMRASNTGAILRISADDPNPERARDIANKLAELLILDIQTSQLVEIGRLEALAQSQGISVSREVLQAQLSSIDSLRVIEPAIPPIAPFAPTPTRNAIFGVVLGLLVAGAIIFLLEYFNNSIRSVDQIQKMVGNPSNDTSTIGVIFRWNPNEVGGSALVVRDAPSSIYAEMFRQLRTGFQFIRSVHNAKAILVTSSAPLEGKSTITANLAAVLAQGGSRVILVDCDLRRPSGHRIFGLPGVYQTGAYSGLSSLLIDPAKDPATELVDVGVPNLRVMTTGRLPPNPADLLASPRAKEVFDRLREACDILLVDSPPIMAAADPMILASYMDGVMLAVTMGETRSSAFRDAIAQIQKPGTKVLGFVLNKVKSRRIGYGRYNYHYYYYYPRREDVEHTENGHGGAESGSRASRRGRGARSGRWGFLAGIGRFFESIVEAVRERLAFRKKSRDRQEAAYQQAVIHRNGAHTAPPPVEAPAPPAKRPRAGSGRRKR